MARVLKKISQAILLVASLGIAAAIPVIWHLDSWGLTPERAARRDGYCQDAPLMKAQQQTPTTAIVVCQGLPTSLDGGHVVVSRLPWGVWWASPTGGNFSYQATRTTSNTTLVDYIHSGPTQSVHTSLILLGRVRSPDVTALEATLSNGRVLKNEVTNGLFVFDAPLQTIGVKVDQLKILGQGNQVLQLVKVKSGY